ncbi:transcription termination factor MTERF8, chloroplastic-like isoform X2 [Euphorbia lathyris]|uniref:transcription termination factor MTERF8, chloroplastic-like isoform X2 n=1 Tax=Euphorbia lathyris TaxID=212925 RepID=UPI003314483E
MANKVIRNVMFPHIRLRFLHSSGPPLPTAATSSPSFNVDFLINSCGLSLKSALSVSNKFQLNDKTPQNPQSVLQLLKSHHFSDSHVAQLIVKLPRVLSCRIHDNLKPKFEYLDKIGFEDSDDKLLVAVKRAPWLLSSNIKILLQPNVDALMKEGVPAHVVERFLTLHPRSMFQNPENLINAVNTLKNLGFETTDTMFIHAFRVMVQMSESTWKKKIEVMKSMGFSEEDILKTFKRFPQFLAYSEENIRKTLNFYFNTMKLELETIIVNPALLGYSIEKRVRPRYHVLKVLESKKLIKGIKEIVFIKIVENNFLEKYIDQFIDEVPSLLEFYLGMKEGKSLVLDLEEPISGIGVVKKSDSKRFVKRLKLDRLIRIVFDCLTPLLSQKCKLVFLNSVFVFCK